MTNPCKPQIFEQTYESVDQQPAGEPYEALFVAAMNTAEQAMDYVQNNPDKFHARPGDDKLAIVCREFLKAQQTGPDVSALVEALESILHGSLLDVWGNRDDDGISSAISIGIQRGSLQRWRKVASQALSTHRKQATEVAKLVESIESIIEMQERNYGNGMLTHIELVHLAKAAREALAHYSQQGGDL